MCQRRIGGGTRHAALAKAAVTAVGEWIRKPSVVFGPPAAKLAGFLDGPPSFESAHVEHERDPVDDASAHNLPRQASRLHGAAGKAGKRRRGVVGVDGGQ